MDTYTQLEIYLNGEYEWRVACDIMDTYLVVIVVDQIEGKV